MSILYYPIERTFLVIGQAVDLQHEYIASLEEEIEALKEQIKQ